MLRLSLNYAIVGKRIQQYRHAVGYTQEQLANKADISTNYLSSLETGQASGRLDKYYSIAQALGVTIDMLINDKTDSVSSNDSLFYNQIQPLISGLSINQRKLLIDFIKLLSIYNVVEINDKRG